jgi:ADP-heptose:LPS heptosyltransferase
MQRSIGEVFFRSPAPAAVPAPELAEPRRILVIAGGALESVVACTPVLASLRWRYPGARIAAVVPAPRHTLLEGNPNLDRVIAGGSRGPGWRATGIWRLAAALRAERFDWALVLAAARGPALAARLAGIPRRTGVWRGAGPPAPGWALLLTRAIVQLRSLTDEIAANLELLRGLGIPPQPDASGVFVPAPAADRARRVLAHAGIPPGSPFAALYPGAAEQRTGWPTAYYARLGERIVEELGLPVVVVGAAEDASVGAALVSEMEAPARNLAGQLPLPELAGVMAQARICITCSPGALLLAGAVGTPVLGLRVKPVGLPAWPGARSLELAPPEECDCRAAWGCPGRGCARSIKPGAAFRAARALLERSEATR